MTQVDLVMATHDVALALGAKAHGLAVVGVRVRDPISAVLKRGSLL